MSERALVSIRKISELKPIDGADFIELAIIDGWQVVVKKGEFSAGDPCIYFEIDSFLPRLPKYEFLEKSCLRKLEGVGEGLRLRTIKLRKQISQGLALPVDFFDYNYDHFEKVYDYEYVIEDKNGDLVNVDMGQDVTELLGVVKWDPPVPAQLAGKVRGNFPSFIPKTDQERIQNCFKDVYEPNDRLSWEITEKLDGSSFTAYFYNGMFGVCSRNMDLLETKDNAFWEAARKYNLRERLSSCASESGLVQKEFAIQGELVGPGIQGNPYNLKERELYIFDVYDIARGEYLSTLEREDFIEEFYDDGHVELKHVPVIDEILFGEFKFSNVDEILNYADGKSVLNSKANREGVVFKCFDNTSLSFKAISNKWLLKNDG